MTKSFGYYCLRYIGFAVMIMVIVAVLVFAAYSFAPDFAARYIAGNSGTSVVTVIVPALMVGQVFYRIEQRKMTRGEGWFMALAFTVLAFVLSGAFFAVAAQFGLLEGDAMRGINQVWENGRDILITAGAVFFVVYVLINRLMLWSGVRGAIKTEEKLAAKAARKG